MDLTRLTTADLRALDKALAEHSLLDFIELMWRYVEPSRPFVRGWVVEAICEHLEAVTRGDITKLIINVPPGPGWVENLVMTARGRVRLGDVAVGDRVLTHKGRFCEVTDVHDRGNLPVLKIETWAGRVLHVTPDHLMLTPNGWTEAGALKNGDILAAVHPQEDPMPALISQEEARLLGYLVGDGSLTQRMVMFTNADAETIADFEACATALGFAYTKRDRKGVSVVSLRGGEVVHSWLRGHGLEGKNSYEKSIPPAVLNSCNSIVSAFLGAYWSCDGMMVVRPTQARGSIYRASCTTVSKRLADDLLHALCRVGIDARIRSRSRKLETAAQPGGAYRFYTLEIQVESEAAKFHSMPIVERKRALAAACRRKFQRTLAEDEIVSVEPAGEKECRCLSVSKDHSLTWSDLAVHNCMKSMTTSVFWPAWEWGPKNLPHHRFLCASYSQKLTIRDNVRFQQVIGSPLYRRLWGNRFSPSDTDANKEKFANNRTGWKYATSVGGVGTGERGDRIVLDDPNNVLEAESDAVRATTNQWLTEVMPTRVNDLAASATICIQQRTHEEDATGTLLSGGGDWVHLMIPMRYESDRHCATAIGWEDPREEDGELAWPERFPADALDTLEATMGPYATAGQHQQAPTARGGAIFQRDWWQQFGPDDPVKAKIVYPRFNYVLASLDTAYTEKEENDWSALAILGVWTDPETNAPAIMLARAWRDRLPLNALVQRVAETCTRYKVDGLLIENKAAGIPVAQELRRLYAREDWSIQMTDPTRKGDKVARAHAVVPLFSDGMVHAPNTDWAQQVIDEMAVFPRASHDDLTDAVVQGVRWLRERGMLSRKTEARAQEFEEMMKPSVTRRLYPV